MDKEEIKDKIDIYNVQEKNVNKFLPEEPIMVDYLVDKDGNFIVPLRSIDVVLIDYIKDLELRIKKLEEK